MTTSARKKWGIIVVFPNTEQAVMAKKGPYFRKIFNSTPLALCAGEGLMRVRRFLGVEPSFPERDTVEDLTEAHDQSA